MDSSETLRIVRSSVPASAQAAECRGFLCEDLMTVDVAVVGPDDTVARAASEMRERNLGFLPVCTPDGQVVGVLTDRDLALRVLAEQRPLQTPVADVMSRDPVLCPADAELELADGLMRAHRKRRLPCVDAQGRLAGVLSLADVARYCDHRRAGELLDEIAQRRPTRTTPHLRAL
jgi:CBS domain-containing protein